MYRVYKLQHVSHKPGSGTSEIYEPVKRRREVLMCGDLIPVGCFGNRSARPRKYIKMWINISPVFISGSDSTRITRITRIRTDMIIRGNPSDPCHPCSWSRFSPQRTQRTQSFSVIYYKCLRRNVILYLCSSAFICGFGLPRPVIYAETSARIEWINSRRVTLLRT